MDRNSNKYTLIFSSVMVIVVAVLLSVASITLSPFQQRNTRIEKMSNILSTIGVTASPSEAEAAFQKYITDQVVLNSNGEQVKGDVKAFDIDLKKEQDKAKTGKAGSELYPLFVGKKDGQSYYIIPVRGKGLWGPIWGYVAVKGDMNSIFGVSFGHKSETPGLGAEIETAGFQEQFPGKKIFDDDGKFVSVKVIKGGASPSDLHGVDAVSGATVTSNGVSEMLQRTLANYIPYFKKSGLAKR